MTEGHMGSSYKINTKFLKIESCVNSAETALKPIVQGTSHQRDLSTGLSANILHQYQRIVHLIIE